MIFEERKTVQQQTEQAGQIFEQMMQKENRASLFFKPTEKPMKWSCNFNLLDRFQIT